MKRILWGTIIIFLFLAGCGTDSESGNPTLPGADEIYPMVMVEGSLYEWRRGRAVLDNLPDAEGEIYADSDDSSVYLLISTDWIQEKAIIFDRVSTVEEK